MKFVSNILKRQSGKVTRPYIIGCVAMTVTLGSGDSSVSECQTHDQKDVGSIPRCCGRRVLFCVVNFSVLTLILVSVLPLYYSSSM